MPNHPLSQILNRFRRRLLAIDGTAGLLWGLAGALLWLGVGVWLDLMLELSPSLRVGILASSVILAGLLLATMIRRALFKSEFPSLARQLDQVAGSHGQILSGVELSLAGIPTAHSSNVELTNGLANLAIHQATRLAGEISGPHVVPTRPVQRSGGSLALMLAVGLGISLLLPRLAATEWKRFSDPFGDTPPFSNTEFEVTPGDTSVVYGTGLEIHVTVSGTPVEGVELVLRPRSTESPATSDESAEIDSTPGRSGSPQEEVLQMFPESESKWRATVANVTTPLAYFVRSRTARSERYLVEVITVPLIEAVHFRNTPPKYTGLPTTEGPLPDGGLSGLPGSTVIVTARSNRVLSAGSLVYISQEKRQEIELKPVSEGSDLVQGSFQISGSGKIDVRVTDEAGQDSTSSYSAAVTQLIDERPFVRLMEPRPISFATPNAIVSVVLAAEDDYGISRLQLFRSLNDSRSLPLDVPIASPPARQAYQIVPLDLKDYGLEEGDEIKVFARVEDNDPQVGPSGASGKGTESTIAVIRIISQMEFDRVLQQREGAESMLAKYQEIRRRMEALNEEIEALKKQAQNEPDNENAQAALQNALKELADKMQEEVETLNKIKQDPQNFALEKELNKELERLENSLQQLTKATESLAGNPNATNQEIEEALDKIREQLNGERNEFEQQVMEPLEMLAQALALKQDESRFVQLYRRQRDLADRLESLKGRDKEDDPALKARMRDLEAEQAKIHEELDLLLNDIEEHAARLPDQEDLEQLRQEALAFVAAVRESEADKAMAESETGLAEFSGTRGHDGAKLAADLLEKMVGKCKAMGNGASSVSKEFRPTLSEAMEQSLEQLLQASGMKEGPGQGMGAGGNGGYSARRSTSDNVGLYGNSPLFSGADSAGRGGSSKKSVTGRAGNGAAVNNSTEEGTAHPSETRFKATSGSDATVPLRYRRQTGRYFQRLADELGNH